MTRSAVFQRPRQSWPAESGSRVHSPGARRLFESIGNTPLMELAVGREGSGSRLFAKLEGANPGGSIKDRPVARMLLAALAEGRLSGGRRLLDSSSGNAGISYAQLGAALGVPVTLVVPGNASRERLERIAAHGAELVLTDPVEGYDHAVLTARTMARKESHRYWYCDQYSNANNWRAHFDTTGVEILTQVEAACGQAPDVLVAGVGTGGTLTGVGRRLLTATPSLHIAAVVPELFPGIEGLKPLGQPQDLVPEILDESIVSSRHEVTLEQAAATCRELARGGLFVGPSSGAFVSVARRLACERPHARIVTLLSDSGDRYGSTGLWA